MKYFYYISQQKVEMFLAQARQGRASLWSLSPEFKLGPITIKASQTTEQNTVIDDLLKLLRLLEKEKQIGRSERLGDTDKKHFYVDQGNWRSGLYGFDVLQKYQFVTYVLWRTIGDTLVLLTGSPDNIIGKKVLATGCHLLGTGPSYDTILYFVDQMLKTDESVAVSLQPPTHWVERDSLPFPGVASAPIELGNFPASAANIRLARWWFPLPPFANRAMALSLFCHENLAQLPLRSIETVFRVFSEYEMPQESDRKKLAEEQHVDLDEEGLDSAFSYKRVIVGSPVYTAFD